MKQTEKPRHTTHWLYLTCHYPKYYNLLHHLQKRPENLRKHTDIPTITGQEAEYTLDRSQDSKANTEESPVNLTLFMSLDFSIQLNKLC